MGGVEEWGGNNGGGWAKPLPGTGGSRGVGGGLDIPHRIYPKILHFFTEIDQKFTEN